VAKLEMSSSCLNSHFAELKQFCMQEWAKIPPQGCDANQNDRKHLVGVIASTGGTLNNWL
jgi:hypothetical protein